MVKANLWGADLSQSPEERGGLPTCVADAGECRSKSQSPEERGGLPTTEQTDLIITRLTSQSPEERGGLPTPRRLLQSTPTRSQSPEERGGLPTEQGAIFHADAIVSIP